MTKILLSNYYKPEPLSFVKAVVPEGLELIFLSQPGEAEVINKAANADYLLAGGRARINANVLDAAPELKMIQRSGVGLDSIDLKEIRRRGIPLYVNEGVNARSVAEHTVMLMLGTLRKLHEVNTMTRSGKWVKHDLGIRCHSLYEQQVGLIGLGNIGRHVSEMLKGFGVRVVYYKRSRLSPADERKLGVNYNPLDELLENSKVVSLHCSLTDTTREIIGQSELARMQESSVLINTSRGQLVNEGALVQALQTGNIAGAGLDVFAEEPPSEHHPLLKMNNVLLTPHLSGVTVETFMAMMQKAFRNIKLFDDGHEEEIEACRIL